MGDQIDTTGELNCWNCTSKEHRIAELEADLREHIKLTAKWVAEADRIRIERDAARAELARLKPPPLPSEIGKLVGDGAEAYDVAREALKFVRNADKKADYRKMISESLTILWSFREALVAQGAVNKHMTAKLTEATRLIGEHLENNECDCGYDKPEGEGYTSGVCFLHEALAKLKGEK